MSLSGSDSDEFFDAEDASLTQIASEDLSTEPASLDSGTHFFIDKEALRLKADEVEQRARRIEERRQRLLREEEEPSHPGTSALPAHFDDESSSYSESIASSSVEGLYLTKLKQQTPLTSAVAHQPSSSSSSSPSQLLPENRLQPLANSAAKFSSNSCGVKRAGVGKNGTNNSNSHNTSNNNHSTNEPDLVASTKPPTNFPQEFVPPIAPPRRRKTSRSRASYAESRRSPNPSAYDSEDAVSINSVVPLGLPAPPVETPTSSIGRDFSLPIENVQRGQFVVKPQDNEEDKGLSKEEVRLCENATGSGKETSKEGTGGRLPRRSSNASVKTLEYKTPENSLKATNALPRLRTDSGRQLSDLEILEQIEVLNLDTGEKIPLSVAEDKLPQCVNPLSLHLMRITQEYVSPWFKSRKQKRYLRRMKERLNDSSQDALDEVPPLHRSLSEVSESAGNSGPEAGAGDNDDHSSTTKLDGGSDIEGAGLTEPATDDPPDLEPSGTLKKKASKLKQKLSKKLEATVTKIKNVAESVDEKIQQWQSQHSQEEPAEVDLMTLDPQPDKVKVTTSSKNQKSDFDGIREVQALKGIHQGAVWTMKFSQCGRLLASAGQDHIVRVWVLRDAFEHFNEVRRKSQANTGRDREDSINDNRDCNAGQLQDLLFAGNQEAGNSAGIELTVEDRGPFMPQPFAEYEGHTADVLDVSWSKSNFILSSSMDKTVRLWHISRAECLCVFHHVEFVTAIAFHPRDDRYFLSGSLDGKLRLWNIPDKKVHLWNELEGTHTKLITCANFCQNGKFAVVGSYDGRCVFYTTDQLKYYTQIAVRSSRGKNAQGKKISGIEPMPGEDKILVTSNDSRIRLYDLRDLTLSCKYRGLVNSSSQIKATFSPDGRYVISGSENMFTYIWKTYHDHSAFSSARRDRNAFWENIKVHDASVTSAVFAPKPDIITKQLDDALVPPSVASESAKNYVIVSADFRGEIHVLAHSMRQSE
ncbi:WD repeat-containing protein 44-like isoform X1 [Varroa jacobsoni]|uniref:WD repeat-containing protein 44 n=1 Tax=Varroa destructor TaxID=109461 RepID=A0A7M7J3L9_VARDE|nr:WD repeat-containing protein 44-like isoform X2 [Varroa destructor]XP_022709247.1 WD repeat-containing protein 44-like isoform X1 [Varroa jacobsoni]XP_022709248.1 WD repeat-containing protein 44-like isoform X1 [Varroa jacobsoni]